MTEITLIEDGLLRVVELENGEKRLFLAKR